MLAKVVFAIVMSAVASKVSLVRYKRTSVISATKERAQRPRLTAKEQRKALFDAPLTRE